MKALHKSGGHPKVFDHGGLSFTADTMAIWALSHLTRSRQTWIRLYAAVAAVVLCQALGLFKDEE